jgi:hypothetical protein
VTFEMVANPPSIRGLSRRGDTVYAATDNFGDGYALGASTDEGNQLERRHVLRPDPGESWAAVRDDAQCQATCQALAGQGMMSPGMIWEPTVCSANPSPEPLPEPPMGMDGGGWLRLRDGGIFVRPRGRSRACARSGFSRRASVRRTRTRG